MTQQPDAFEGAATGRTVVHEAAVAKVAAAAARRVSGVHSLGTGPSRALGAIRDAVAQNPTDHAAGVRAEVGQEQAAVDVTLVAAYGVPLQDLAERVRAAARRGRVRGHADERAPDARRVRALQRGERGRPAGRGAGD